jgi:Zn finger protein HypA/HybF involved in hydrogenase expression
MLLATTTQSLPAFVPTFLQGTALSGFFASRTFIPAFVTALTLRFGWQAEWFAWFGIELATAGAPTWFTSNTTLIILGLLAALEVAATKNADARALLAEVDPYLKPAVAVATYLGVASVADAAYLEAQLPAEQAAGFIDVLPALLVGGATYWLVTTRRDATALIAGADEDDDLGIQKLGAWAEDVWAGAGPLLLVIFGLVMVAVIGIVVAMFFVMKKRAEITDERSKIACASCGARVYGCATRCPKCSTDVPSPRAVGFFGQAKTKATPDLQRHPYRLAEKKRCPSCATRLAERRPRQACPACNHDLFADRAFADAYLADVAARLPAVLGVSFLFSLVPIVGLIPGVIYYRIALVAPFRRYIPRGRSLLLRWGVKLFLLLLVLLQWVPLLGGFVVPVMALVNYNVYRAAFAGLLEEG